MTIALGRSARCAVLALMLSAGGMLSADDSPARANALPPDDAPPAAGAVGDAPAEVEPKAQDAKPSDSDAQAETEGAIVAPPAVVAPAGPTPVIAGNGWVGGWSVAYAPGYYYWYGVPAYTYVPTYVPGYSWGVWPPSWNGYWNYSTAYGYPGYTAYWHGWYAGPYYNAYAGPWGYGWYPAAYSDYAWPTWSGYGWGYSTVGWGHGYWLDNIVHSPHGRWNCLWR